MKQDKTTYGSVEYMRNYMNTYADQPEYENYTTNTYLEDMLYGIGVSLSDKYSFAGGSRRFKSELLEYLKAQQEKWGGEGTGKISDPNYSDGISY